MQLVINLYEILFTLNLNMNDKQILTFKNSQKSGTWSHLIDSKKLTRTLTKLKPRQFSERFKDTNIVI